MPDQPRRMERESKTLEAMIRIFCRDRHGSRKDLCPDCRDLQTYALKRLEKCPFGEEKPACSRCTVHCYKPAMRERIRDVMRYAGPRMIRRHPVLAVAHLLDRRHKAPSS